MKLKKKIILPRCVIDQLEVEHIICYYNLYKKKKKKFKPFKVSFAELNCQFKENLETCIFLLSLAPLPSCLTFENLSQVWSRSQKGGCGIWQKFKLGAKRSSLFGHRRNASEGVARAVGRHLSVLQWRRWSPRRRRRVGWLKISKNKKTRLKIS